MSCRPLRILLLNERCHANPLAGGAEVHLFEIFSRLVAQGSARVELLCCGYESAAPTDEYRGVRITRIGKRLSYYRRVTSAVRARLAAGQVDLIVEAHNKVPFLTPLYARVPVVVIHHHLHGLTAFRQVPLPIALGSVALESLVPLVYRRVPILTISASSKDDLVRRGLPEQHIDVVPCGIDHQQYSASDVTEREPLVLSVGRLEPYKRLDLLLAAMRRVVWSVSRARLAIVGRGQQQRRLKQLAQRLGLADRVVFPGFVSEAEKVAWMRRASVIVQCSTKEGWGLTVTEAYACGVPVVATDVPGLSDSVQDGVTGLLVRKPRPEPLAAAIGHLLQNEERRVTLARHARAWSQSFRWEEAAAAIGGTLQAAARAPEPSSLRQPVPLQLGADR